MDPSTLEMIDDTHLSDARTLSRPNYQYDDTCSRPKYSKPVYVVTNHGALKGKW